MNKNKLYRTFTYEDKLIEAIDRRNQNGARDKENNREVRKKF